MTRLVVVLALVAIVGAACRITPADHTSTREPLAPLPGTRALTWQLQLTARPDLSVPADMYVLDAFDAPVSAVDRLHKKGITAICRFSVGIAEPSRPDYARFPMSVLGTTIELPAGGAGREANGQWWDIRAWSVLAPILSDRFALCRDKGFDAVDPTDVDGFARHSGFPLTAADQLAYNRAVAALAHDAGLMVGLHNDLSQAADLAPAFDFAIDESCLTSRACGDARVFLASGKPVFHLEYADSADEVCPELRMLGYASIVKRSPVEAWRATCQFSSGG